VAALGLTFSNGYVLSIFDNPDFRSWWFLSSDDVDRGLVLRGDCEIEDVLPDQYRGSGRH
jgi:hypothetical protein